MINEWGPRSIYGHSRMEKRESHGDLVWPGWWRSSRSFESSSRDAERNCWLVVQPPCHGVSPVKYDIREIPQRSST